MLQKSSILRPDDTVWTTAVADRAAVLNDGASYFGALRAALLRAESHVLIVGWDIHSRTRLVGADGRASDGFPEELGALLGALVQSNSALRVDILVWDYATLYAAEREWDSAERFLSVGCGRIRFRKDASLPLGSAQHQKFVVVDGALAFVGGLDLTIRRWDTSDLFSIFCKPLERRFSDERHGARAAHRVGFPRSAAFPHAGRCRSRRTCPSQVRRLFRP